MDPNKLEFNSEYWQNILPPMDDITLDTKLHLILSLVLYLAVTVRQLLEFIFTTEITAVKSKASVFMSRRKSLEQFAPAVLFQLWHTRWPKVRTYLHEMIIPCAHEIALEESDSIIRDPDLQINVKKLTVASIRELLRPEKILEKYRASAPFIFGLLYTFSASPNRYRKEKAAREEKKSSQRMGTEDGAAEDANDKADESGPEDVYEGASGPHAASAETPLEGFSRNPVFAIILAITMLAFVRNRATNALPLLLGLFFKISGTSARVLTMLSNTGICVSSNTVERLKKRISEDAIAFAVDLMKSGQIFFVIFDNINIFIRKFQQRTTNRNTMIHATNAAVIGLSGVDAAAENLKEKLDLRGKRSAATIEDILPTREDDAHMRKAFTGLIADMLIRYCPGNQKWEDRAEMLKEASDMIPKDRPRKRTRARSGFSTSTKGLKRGSSRSSSKYKNGQHLPKRNARRDRFDDVDTMERVENPEELSALWHHALQASHKIMRTHYGNAVLDPTSLAAHKGLLNRTWDVNKPNYAAAKALIKHSLIARLLHIVMLFLNMTLWSELSAWRPNMLEIREISEKITAQFATTAAAEDAKKGEDDYLAHAIYFIRDALFFFEFEHAVSWADAGRVLRVLKYWAFSFRGASQHNYARECAEILIKLKYEVTQSLRAALEKACNSISG
ncbi:hypothetical protein PLICRDRAFT_181073 [Plicaturopsis crispa FD-325 SS-3]|uniref:DUF6589 domain-containing protein n=1 Tax=Plicaturopsis crispa FD-325 SS-3 TaxID=944288 RepID=A0A0C9SPM0_PLICR|nr:hypothetical protein PLICRDRAFT_181073 [Plicaturopsis crispa FD-325 SS-3]